MYNTALVQHNIEKFQMQGYKPSDVTLFFDLDNTLCLFSYFGTETLSMQSMYSKGFYRSLPCFPEAPPVLKRLQQIGYNVCILSSCIDSPYCKKEKLEWVHHYLPFIRDSHIKLVEVGEDKSKYIMHPSKAILVDDYYKNLEDIYNSGGVGIKKTYSGKSRVIPQVNSLEDIFNVLKYLNCWR